MAPSAGGRAASLPVQRSSVESFLVRVDPKLIARRYFYRCIYILWNHLVPLKL